MKYLKTEVTLSDYPMKGAMSAKFAALPTFFRKAKIPG